MENKCAYEECEEEATTLTEDRAKHTIEWYCDIHADIIVEKTHPEYYNTCPNCGCLHGVN